MKTARQKWKVVCERKCFCGSQTCRREHEAARQRREAIARAQEQLFEDGTRPDRGDASPMLQLTASEPGSLTLAAANM